MRSKPDTDSNVYPVAESNSDANAVAESNTDSHSVWTWMRSEPDTDSNAYFDPDTNASNVAHTNPDYGSDSNSHANNPQVSVTRLKVSGVIGSGERRATLDAVNNFRRRATPVTGRPLFQICLDEFRRRVDVDLPKHRVTTVHESVRCVCRNNGDVAGFRLPGFVADRYQGATFDHENGFDVGMGV